MYGRTAANAELLNAVRMASHPACPVAVCVPFPYLHQASEVLDGSGVHWGAQNLSEHVQNGAYTGEVSGEMLADFGCRYVIVGHSERRALFGESDALVAAKAAAALACGLIPIVCVGETLGTAVSQRTRRDAVNSVNLIRAPAHEAARQCVVERWDYDADADAFGLAALSNLALDPHP